jgi:hypothetical protein
MRCELQCVGSPKGAHPIETVDLEAARAGFVNEPQLAILAPQPTDQLRHRLEIAADRTEVPHLARSAFLGDRHVDRILVDIETYVGVSLFHGLPPSAWLCAG